jgi:phosphatidylinositol dimannoside acyltransferase
MPGQRLWMIFGTAQAAMTQQVARLFEAGIRAHPQDWHMLQKVFVADLDPARLAAAAGAASAARSEGQS